MGEFIKIALSLVLIVLKAIVFSSTWGWFVAPLGVMEIDIWHAFGLSMIIQVYTSMNPFNSEDSSKHEDFTEKFLASAIGYLVVWGLSAIIHYFLM